MSLTSLMTDDVTIITPTFTTNSRGDRVKNWTVTTETNKKGWMAQTNASANEDELSSNREGTLTYWRLFLPLGSLLDNTCRIRYLGDLYEVDGEVHISKTPSGPHHLEVPLKKVKG